MANITIKDTDKKLLQEWGFSDKDINQIGYATLTNITKYYKISEEGTKQQISKTEAIEILGRRTWLSGISRSAFHFDAVRDNGEGTEVLFDSSKLFK